MANTVLEYFNKAISLEETDLVPVVIWGVTLWYSKRLGIKAFDYYHNDELHLKLQTGLQAKYPEALMLPGIYPDFGLAAEAPAFGCPIIWREDDAPALGPAITDISQVSKMKPVNVKEDGLFPQIIKRYEYMMRNIDHKLVEDYGYVEGSVFFLGPLEVAAAIRGYCEFLMDLNDHSVMVHKLLDMVTNTLLEWLQYVETKIGRLQRVIMADHFPCQVSPQMFEEFCFPYFKKIFDQYPNAMKLYHNEGTIEKILHRIPDMGANIFHFGTNIKATKEAIGNKLCLLGNLNPVALMQDATPEEITKEALKVLEIGAKGGGFVLTSAGAFGTQIPDENIQAMLDAVKIFKTGI